VKRRYLHKISIGLYEDLYKRLKKRCTHRGEFSYLINVAVSKLLDEKEADNESQKSATRR